MLNILPLFFREEIQRCYSMDMDRLGYEQTSGDALPFKPTDVRDLPFLAESVSLATSQKTDQDSKEHDECPFSSAMYYLASEVFIVLACTQFAHSYRLIVGMGLGTDGYNDKGVEIGTYTDVELEMKAGCIQDNERFIFGDERDLELLLLSLRPAILAEAERNCIRPHRLVSVLEGRLEKARRLHLKRQGLRKTSMAIRTAERLFKNGEYECVVAELAGISSEDLRASDIKRLGIARRRIAERG